MLKLPEIITDKMILSYNEPVLIWGETDDAYVEVLIDSEIKASGRGGKFEISLPPFPAGGPHTVTIKTESDKIEIRDVYFGEVWIAGGQSNMEFRLRDDSEYKKAAETAKADLVRQFDVPRASHGDARILHPEEFTVPPRWISSDKDTCGDFSAVAWWSAINYHKKYGIPVGIINCNWGGTSASCWISRADIKANRTASLYLEDYEKAMEGKSLEDYIKIYTDYYSGKEKYENNVRHLMETEGLSEKEASEDERAGERPYWPPPHGPWNFGSPANLYEGMLSTVIPYTVSKVLWYQGEEDIRVYERYYEMLTYLIACFRKYFRSKLLPFYIVQIAPYLYAEDPKAYNRPPYLREIQSKVVESTEHTALIVTTDCGDRDDIHPKQKRIVGERIFNTMCTENGEAIDSYSAKMVNCVKIKNRFVVEFDRPLLGEHAKGFLLSDKNRRWHFANADISGNKVTVTSDDVNDPIAVRYAFANYIYSDLYGKNGMPAEPFRTDDFLPDETDMSVCME